MFRIKKPPPEVLEQLAWFMKEDVRSGDVTTNAMIPLKGEATGTIFSKDNSILAGIEEIIALAHMYDLKYEVLIYEENWVEPGQPVMRLIGAAKKLLVIERVSLNIIQRMSGIATKTYRMVKQAQKTNPKVRVAATRKTTPGFRYFEKRAVEIGEGDSHRYALDDMVLIKNNHIDVVGGVTQAVQYAKKSVSFSKKISCEARNANEAWEAINAGADIVLLDNFTPDAMKDLVEDLTKKGKRDSVILEASGGMNEENVATYAATGIDIISSGALTHSYKAADFNMRISLN